jgi:hypothetical protein
MMAAGKVEGNRFRAQCEKCGRWLEVQPQPAESAGYFVQWQATFSCCGREQTATFTREKDEIDFH